MSRLVLSDVLRRHATRGALALMVALTAASAGAEKTDRAQPLTIEADKSSTVDLAKRVVVFQGNVVITQGTMRIEADRVEVRETPEGFRSALATGTPAQPASFRQKRDGVDETIVGQAQRIEYDGRADIVRLSGDAAMRRLRGSAPADEVTGQLITYDNANELFSVTGAGSDSRVRAVLTPRSEPAPAGSGKRP